MLLVCFACSSTDELQVIEGVGQMQDSPVGYEDCGWVINLEGQFYKPSYVPSQYRVEGLEVFISLEDLYTEENCQSAGNTLIGGRIIQISQR